MIRATVAMTQAVRRRAKTSGPAHSSRLSSRASARRFPSACAARRLSPVASSFPSGEAPQSASRRCPSRITFALAATSHAAHHRSTASRRPSAENATPKSEVARPRAAIGLPLRGEQLDSPSPPPANTSPPAPLTKNPRCGRKRRLGLPVDASQTAPFRQSTRMSRCRRSYVLPAVAVRRNLH